MVSPTFKFSLVKGSNIPPPSTCDRSVLRVGNVPVGLLVNVRLGQTKVNAVNNIFLHFRCSSNQKIFGFNITESASFKSFKYVICKTFETFSLVFDIITGKLARYRELSLFF